MTTISMRVLTFNPGVQVIHKDGTCGTVIAVNVNEFFGVDVWNANKNRKEGWHINSTFLNQEEKEHGPV